MALVNGTSGDDFIHRANDGQFPGGANDIPLTTAGVDTITGGLGDDTIFADGGADIINQNVTSDGADSVNGGEGSDAVIVSGAPQVRLTFTSAEVGNGIATDSGTLPNQDGGLAVRLQAEDGAGALTGATSRYDDEGVSFVASGGLTFDVRDLTTGAARGELFEVVTLGTLAGDTLGAVQNARPYYINGGGGADTITDGSANDFLVGGAGNDTLTASLGNDSFIGGGGDDSITGGAGSDVATVNLATDGADQIDLGSESDVVNVNATTATNVRLTFTSAEVGNGVATDSNTLPNQDGGLAVRMQAEDATGALTGPITRTDDEGVTYVGGAGVTFDVRDLTTGAARGELFEVVTLGTSAGDTLGAVQNARPYYINGGQGNDTITDGSANDFLVGGAGNDTLTASLGNDSFIGGGGDDSITGGAGSDVATVNVTTDGADQINLGSESDVVNVNSTTPSQVRLTFTSAEVGNGVATDSGTLANQDGGLAVRMQAEDANGALTGPITRTDDEGVTFVAGVGVTFDVRDLVLGAARGDQFEVVTLGTSAGDTLGALQNARPYYINGGQGNDTITDGSANDFLVGGAGNDTLTASLGNDSFIGGGGDDSITGGAGSDVATVNVTTDGADQIDLGSESDVVNVNATAATNVRLTFTSAEVGNGVATDSGTLANQDGGLAVRMQAEDANGALTGPITRTDDEGVTFVAGAGVTFDVRDLVSGAARGEQFEVVTLGTSADDTLGALQNQRPYYINGGQGNDTISGSQVNDFLVGGAGNDSLFGGFGDDSFIGGGGNDTITGGRGADTAIHNVTTDGADAVDLGVGADVVTVNATAATNVRLTFTSAEVGNGLATDSNTLPNQDGGLALRMQAENASGALTGLVSRFDDEGVTYVAGAGVTFDVRDLTTGAARGETFEVVQLGNETANDLAALDKQKSYYINAGQGNDTVTGGQVNDFLVGGAGNDSLFGGFGDDSFIGGGGDDTVTGGRGADTAIHNVTTDGADAVDLGVGADTVTVNATAATNVRLTFTSAEVGNGLATDSGSLANQDGGLAVRMQAEDASGALTGPVTRVDDEGVSFVGGAGVTFDVRDLVSGAARGETFQVVQLGNEETNFLSVLDVLKSTYINAGGGDDNVTGGQANDFLVGGGGNDVLRGQLGNDSFIGGDGDDTVSGGGGLDNMTGGLGADIFVFDAAVKPGNVDTVTDFTSGTDTIRLSAQSFLGLGVGGLDDDAFTIGTSASDAEDRIVYDQSSGNLFFDRDGSGSQFGLQKFAELVDGTALTADDFRIA